MQAIEMETEIDENHEIHLKLPADVMARKAKVVVMYEDNQSDRKATAHLRPVPRRDRHER